MPRRNNQDNRPMIMPPDEPEIDEHELGRTVSGSLTYEEKQAIKKGRQDWIEEQIYKAKKNAADAHLQDMNASTTYHFRETALDIDQNRSPAAPGDKLQQDLNDFSDDQMAIAKRLFKANLESGGKNVIEASRRSVKPEPRKRSKLGELIGGE